MVKSTHYNDKFQQVCMEEQRETYQNLYKPRADGIWDTARWSLAMFDEICFGDSISDI